MQRLQEVESKMREELHERLESMVLDVEDVINANERADQQTETFETDELYANPLASALLFTDIVQVQAKVPKFHRSIRDARASIHFTDAAEGS